VKNACHLLNANSMDQTAVHTVSNRRNALATANQGWITWGGKNCI